MAAPTTPSGARDTGVHDPGAQLGAAAASARDWVPVSLVPPVIEAPRSAPLRRSRTAGNFELYSWVFQRASGVLLVVLVLGHLFIMNILDGGVQRINFGFVAGRWASPFWQTWDLLLLWLAQIHGTNGMRTVINDYTRRDGTRMWLKAVLYAASVLVIGLGTLVIFTFDPSI